MSTMNTSAKTCTVQSDVLTKAQRLKNKKMSVQGFNIAQTHKVRQLGSGT